MLISPQYRAQNEQGFLFEALFGITDDGVVFQGTFDLLFDVGKLIGTRTTSSAAATTTVKPRSRIWTGT